MKTLSDVINAYCRNYRVTQTEVARRAGLTKQHMSKLMNGYTLSAGEQKRQIDPTLSLLRTLAEAMRMRTADLVAMLDDDMPLTADAWRRLESERFERVTSSAVSSAVSIADHLAPSAPVRHDVSYDPSVVPQMSDDELRALAQAVARVMAEQHK